MAEGKQKMEEGKDISAGSIDKVVDLAFNPSREKIREVTIVDRLQARLLPALDTIGLGWRYCIEVAYYNEDPKKYSKEFGREKPVCPSLVDEYVYRFAQWQKSIMGKNFEKLADIGLAEIEAKFDEGIDLYGDKDLFGDK